MVTAQLKPQVVAAPALPVLRFPPEHPLTDELLLRIGDLNDGWRFERTTEGSLAIMAAATPRSDRRGSRIFSQVDRWEIDIAGGEAFAGTAGFEQLDGAVRSPDVSWVSDAAIDALQGDLEEGFWPLCPEFVVEVRSPSQELEDQQRKMEQWIAYGALLGWLVDPEEETVWIYRPGREPELARRPLELSGEPELPGLVVSFREVWRAPHAPSADEEG